LTCIIAGAALFNSRLHSASSLTRSGLLGSRIALVAVASVICFQLSFTYLSPMQSVPDSHPLSITAWVQVILVSASVFILVELKKWVLRLRRGLRGAAIQAPVQLD
jgi:hypothetical protein